MKESWECIYVVAEQRYVVKHGSTSLFACMFGIAELMIAKPGERVSIFRIDNAMHRQSK